MEDSIHERIGQRHAVVSVSKAIRRARVGLRDPIDQLQVLYSLDQLVLENQQKLYLIYVRN
jgi:ATP-dependent Clp protease ATP-binding subunit ClpA